jgi:hypothetical protein
MRRTSMQTENQTNISCKQEKIWKQFYSVNLTAHILTESESYVTTDGQPASVSWGLRLDLYYCLTVAGLVIWGALSDERRVCRLQLLLALASAVIFRSESHRTRGHILLSQIRDFSFRRLLRIAGSRWRYSIPPPHELHISKHLYHFEISCERTNV